MSHVYQNYFRPETLSAAHAPLVDAQATLRLAQAWGGGLVAAVDGMRFVVPVPAAFARPNRKYFGSKRGMTWLNAINDRGMGRGAKVVSGKIRDSLHMVDVIFGFDRGALPEIIVTDTGSYSDLVFGLKVDLGKIRRNWDDIVRVVSSIYFDAAVTQLRDQDYPIREDDLARLSPFVHSHLGVLGTYTFATPDLAPGTIRDLRDPDAPEEDEA